jgi:hypothetical protein
LYLRADLSPVHRACFPPQYLKKKIVARLPV